MRRILITLSLTISSVALLAPSGSVAAVAPGYYGSTDAGGELNFGAKFDGKGRPAQVKHLRWANIPATCPGFPPLGQSGDLKITIKVDSHGEFKGSDKLPTGAKVTIKGKFKHHYEKASGTFRIKGGVAGCSNVDTGSLGWDAHRKP